MIQWAIVVSIVCWNEFFGKAVDGFAIVGYHLRELLAFCIAKSCFVIETLCLNLRLTDKFASKLNRSNWHVGLAICVFLLRSLAAEFVLSFLDFFGSGVCLLLNIVIDRVPVVEFLFGFIDLLLPCLFCLQISVFVCTCIWFLFDGLVVVLGRFVDVVLNKAPYLLIFECAVVEVVDSCFDWCFMVKPFPLLVKRY